MYVYNSNMWKDLFDVVQEYMGESEHMGMRAEFPGCLDSDNVDDLNKWTEKRRLLLLRDFSLYMRHYEAELEELEDADELVRNFSIE